VREESALVLRHPHRLEADRGETLKVEENSVNARLNAHGVLIGRAGRPVWEKIRMREEGQRGDRMRA
jgi:hypothetical protein